ncbi:MAG: divergent PAP2 family protein [Eubacteriales bacterium]|nr:divergent PAP2 family protein [Eubacteriales bacterium]MDY2982420.1 divergent PAP2 family protein [Eubacteriales bacterium]
MDTAQRLKEMVGHTPLQVFCGAVLGIFIGILF